MTHSLLLTAVSAVLKRTLENGLADPAVAESIGGEILVTAQPPDRVAVGGEERPQLNLFLYQITPNTSLRPSRPGGARPMGSFDLHYLVSAYGPGDLVIETLIGAAIQIFHEAAAIDGERFGAAIAALGSTAGGRTAPPAAAVLERAGLGRQVAGLQITPQFLTIEDASRLWSAVQSRMRPSLAYKVSVAMVAP